MDQSVLKKHKKGLQIKINTHVNIYYLQLFKPQSSSSLCMNFGQSAGAVLLAECQGPFDSSTAPCAEGLGSPYALPPICP